jgi:hypothetical protein
MRGSEAVLLLFDPELSHPLVDRDESASIGIGESAFDRFAQLSLVLGITDKAGTRARKDVLHDS